MTDGKKRAKPGSTLAFQQELAAKEKVISACKAEVLRLSAEVSTWRIKYNILYTGPQGARRTALFVMACDILGWELDPSDWGADPIPLPKAPR